jgi:peptide/nickel transport system permease protein
LKQYSIFDHVVTTFSFIVFHSHSSVGAGVYLRFRRLFQTVGLPPYRRCSSRPEAGSRRLAHGLPVAAISGSIAAYSRYVRANMLEVLSHDYIRTAHAKGLTSRNVIVVHALKNAALPLVTVVGLDLPFLLAGAVVTESIFAWPGMGRLFYDHTTRSDFPVLMGIIMIIALMVVLFQIITDVVYTFLDPRIRYD